ncbi:MAG: single-stranded DNA-binding protein [Mucinivorans sp.]
MLNKVILVGNVGRDPEVRVLETGSKMARFTMATNEKYYTATGQEATHTEWHNIVAWRAAATYVEENIRVGAEIYVEGSIRSRQAIDPRTKTSATIYEIIAHTVRLTSQPHVNQIVENTANELSPKIPKIEDPNKLPF